MSLAASPRLSSPRLRYNDHHFHYGYFVYAAAVVGKFNKPWFARHKDKIYPIVYDTSRVAGVVGGGWG